MTDAHLTLPAVPHFGARLLAFVRHLPQRFHEPAFWITQALVVGVTLLHVLAEAWTETAGWEVPGAFHHLPVILYLAPISYACLRFGTEGAILTGIWSALLTLPNLLIWHREDFEWFELVYVFVVIAVGTTMALPVERERQQRRLAEATSQRLTLLDTIATLTLTADLQSTLDETLARLIDMLGAEAACVAVADPADPAGPMRVLACHPGPDHAGGELATCLQERHFTGGPPASRAGEEIAVVPLAADLPRSGPEGRVSGALAVKGRAMQHLNDEDRRLLAGVASHLAVAIANERLSESERERLRTYAMLVTQAQEDERRRIARDLHDEAAQNVVVMRRELGALASELVGQPAEPELRRLQELARQTVDGMRRFSRDLRPPTLDQLGLASALDQLVGGIRERGDLDVELQLTGQPRRLPTETELAVFRIGQAALHNVERHAEAGRIDVVLGFGSDEVRLLVTDDGRGFVPPSTGKALLEAGKLGLVGMHERAQLVGGTLSIESAPGEGTKVTFVVPA